MDLKYYSEMTRFSFLEVRMEVIYVYAIYRYY